jgi:F-type H+-transporting ATPase subunit b
MLDSLLKSLNIEPMVLLLNGVLFLVLVFVLNRLFWQPMLRHLDTRREQISSAYKTVDDTRREMENLRSEYQARLARMEQEARGRIQSTVREAQAQREGMIAEARRTAEELAREGAESIERDHAATMSQLRAGANRDAADALASVLGGPPDETQLGLVRDFATREASRS